MSLQLRLLTESDHIPIITNIAARAVTKPTPPTLNMKQAQWDLFKEEVSNKISVITIPEQMTRNEIDNTMQQWYDVIC